ncbi:hypothetical protein ACE6H2_013298 [Prunus campanulata]
MMVELFVLGCTCTGVVVFLHGASFFFHLLTHHLALRSLSKQKYKSCRDDRLVAAPQVVLFMKYRRTPQYFQAVVNYVLV